MKQDSVIHESAAGQNHISFSISLKAFLSLVP